MGNILVGIVTGTMVSIVSLLIGAPTWAAVIAGPVTMNLTWAAFVLDDILSELKYHSTTRKE